MKINRKELKKGAKQALRKTYLMALVMSVILCIAGAVSYNSSSGNSGAEGDSQYEITIPTGETGLPELSYNMNDLLASVGITNSIMNTLFGSLTIAGFVTTLIAMAVFMAVVSSLFRLLIGFQLEVGARGYFLDTAENRQSGVGRLAHGFTRGAYGKVLVTMFLRSLYTFLWGVLFIIPGVIKDISYSMVPYILAENPTIGHKRALELSRNMTNGFKWQIFLLRLSFIGWYILGTLLFYVGQILVWPYENATFAQLYLTLRKNAINLNITSNEELGTN